MSEHHREPAFMVGREATLTRLREAYARAVDGEATVAVVVGESGVGKSMLVRAFDAEVDATHLFGGCVPVAGEAMPFAPIIAAMRGLAATLSADARDRFVARWPAVFAALMPGNPLPDQDRLTGSEGADPTPVSDTGQVRLFESLLSMLVELAGDAPVVWVVEDLQWADRSTLDLVSYLTRNLGIEPVLVVLTVRSDDLHRDSPLRAWLAELDRLPSACRVPVDRLDRLATQAQLHRLLDSPHPPSPAEVDRVYERSAGNPLFTEQLLPWTKDTDASLPETLSDLVAARFAALPSPTRQLLGVAAIIGRDFELDVLADVAEQDADEVEASLQPAVDHNTIRPGDGLRYSFAHPVHREVLEAQLLPGSRRRLHGATAAALDARRASGPDSMALTARLAYHWDRAGVPELAYAAAIEAGLAAEGIYAFAEADEQLSRAVQLRVDAGTAAGAYTASLDDVDLLMHASQAAHLTGDGERAVRLVTEAAEGTADAVRRSALLERKGAYCFNAGMPHEADAAYAQALALLPSDPSAARARVLAGIGLLAMAWSRMDDAELACTQAIEMARQTGARHEEGRALNALGVVTAHRGHFDEGITSSRESVRIAAELADPDELAVAYIDLAHVLGLAGRYDEAAEVCDEGYQAMRRVGLVRQDGSFLQANAAESLIKAGRLERAGDVLDVAIAQRARGVRAFPVLLQMSRWSLHTGDVPAARAWLDQTHGVLGDFAVPDSWRRELNELDAEVMAWERRPRESADLATEAIDLAATGDEQRLAGALFCLAARALADQRDDLAPSDPRGAELVRARHALEARAAEFRPDPLEPDAALFDGAAVAATLRAELARFDRAPDVADRWAVAAKEWEVAGQPFRAAYAHWREAEALVLGKRSGGQVVAAVRRAHDAAVMLGAKALAAEAERLARWGRVELVDTSTGEQDVDPMDDLDLTARELEVLSGLVAGRTNKEVAESLFISVKTASVHVSNILRKLDVSTREEAARIGYQHSVPPAS